MTDQPLTTVAGPVQVPSIPARLEPDAIGVAQDTIIGLGLVRAGRHDGGHAGHASGGGRLRRRSGRHLVRGPDADHRQLLSPAQPVERQLRRFLRVGRPRDQPLPGLHGRLADARGLPDRDDLRGRGPLPRGPGHLRRQRHQYLAEHLPQHRRHHRHAHRGRGRHSHHRADPGRLGGDRIHGPARRLDLGPGVRARPPSRRLPDHQGLAEPERDRRAKAAWRRDCSSRSSCSPAGTPRSTSTRK